MKSTQEVQFEQLYLKMDQQFSDIQANTSNRKLREEQVFSLKDKLKSLSIVLLTVEQNLRKNIRSKRYNQYDLKLKIKQYNQKFQKLSERLQLLQHKIIQKKKQELLMHKNLTLQDIDNIKRQQRMNKKLQNTNITAGQAQVIVTDTHDEVKRQGVKLNQMQDGLHDIQHQLTLTEQISKVIVNRQMISKLILFLLVFFLGLADVMILLLKII